MADQKNLVFQVTPILNIFRENFTDGYLDL